MTSHVPGWLPPRRLAYLIAGVVAALIAARVLLDSSSELGEAADSLDRVRWGWVVIAVAVELASYVAFGRAIQRLLAKPDRKPLVSLTAAAITAQAASQCIPGGAATSAVVAYRQVRRLGVGEVPSAAAIVVANVLQAAVLPLLALIGAELPGPADPIPGLRAVSISLIAVIVVGGAVLFLLRARQLPRRSLVWAVLKLETLGKWLRRRVLRQTTGTTDPRTSLVGRIDDLDVGGGQVALAAVLCTLFWAGDALCLAAAFPAIGAGVPWRGLLLAYPAAQLVSALPIVPGGLGIVEGSLTAGLVAYGGATETALAAVLLYRLISFWGLIPVGGLTWLGLRAKYPLAAEEPSLEPVAAWKTGAAALGVGMLLAGPLLTGCGVTRDGALSPSVNDCVAALPVAHSLAGSGAHFDLLRRYSLPETQRILARLGAPALVPADATPSERASIAASRSAAGATARPGAKVAGPRPCLVLFTGSFTTSAIVGAPGHPAATAVSGPASGGYLLVVTTTRHPRVLRAVVSGSDPLA